MPFLTEEQKQMLLDAAKMSVDAEMFDMEFFMATRGFTHFPIEQLKEMEGVVDCDTTMCLAGSIVLKAVREGVFLPGVRCYDEYAFSLLKAGREQSLDLEELFVSRTAIRNIDSSNVFEAIEAFAEGGFDHMVEVMDWEYEEEDEDENEDG